MAEEKTFRYGLIILGFFLVMVGMFIMSVEKPHIYITFCTLGILIIAVGIVWSMCQCYPKVRVVSVDPETETFLVKKTAALSTENEIPEKSSSQAPYTTQKEADVYEKSLPSYEQVQAKVASAGGGLGGPPTPVLPVRVGGGSQPTVQAKVEVHRDSESDGGTSKGPTSQQEATRLYRQPERVPSQAPLASLQEEMDNSSVASNSNSPFLQRWKDAPDPGCSTESQLRFKLPSYEDFAMIDSLLVEGQEQSNEPTVAPIQSHCPAPPTTGHGSLITAGAGLLEHRTRQNMEDDTMYYGIKEESEVSLTSVDAVFDQSKIKD
ncbi:Barttin [Varanus komodoensis]|uniref:barttin n=1 Tax=Varanus komodoensis TaxID=61221 RepID=UPI001CF78DFA|nr:barttin [Varanus komodoensis]KAF7244394.1 Barttin [Varanus komodoensis]